MPNKATLRVCVLWEHEIRAAAKALHAANEAMGTDEQGKAVAAALNACQAPLFGAHYDGYTLVLASAPTGSPMQSEWSPVEDRGDEDAPAEGAPHA